MRRRFVQWAGAALTIGLLVAPSVWAAPGDAVIISIPGREAQNQAAGSAPVAATGQSSVLPFAAVDGSDGALQRGVSQPSPRFTDNGNGTVTDNLTGLIWLAEIDCLGSYPAVDVDGTLGDHEVFWQTALDFVDGINSGTYDCGDTSNGGTNQTDWRLPNVRELQSLIHYGYASPAISNAAGDGQADYGGPFSTLPVGTYWSATENAFAPTTNVWAVSLSNGGTITPVKTTMTQRVWAVRYGD